MAEYHAENNENRRADEIKAEKDKKHSFSHDFFVAAFTVAQSLFFEHLHDIIEFALEFFRSLFLWAFHVHDLDLASPIALP